MRRTSVGELTHPTTAPAGNNRSSLADDNVADALLWEVSRDSKNMVTRMRR
jgi:hypothetical protein